MAAAVRSLCAAVVITGALSQARPVSVPQTFDWQPPRRFSFRWTHPAGEEAVEGNSLLVTFELVAQGEGTLVRFRETGFRERGWAAAVAEATYQDHVQGWDHFLPRLVAHAAALDARP